MGDRRHRPQPGKDLQRRLGRAVRQQEGELVPSVAGQEVEAAQLAGPGVGQLPQEAVACLVAGGVVQPLEVVEVEDHQRQGRLLPA